MDEGRTNEKLCGLKMRRKGRSVTTYRRDKDGSYTQFKDWCTFLIDTQDLGTRFKLPELVVIDPFLVMYHVLTDSHRVEIPSPFNFRFFRTRLLGI